MTKIELLAPAQDVSVMKACYNAGADAVYMGLSDFSARAFAKNASVEEYTEAIFYAHLHKKKIYCTMNTLVKEREMTKFIESLKPLQEAGLDGVIVEDFGAMMKIHECFPDLPIHASTQCTVTGPVYANRLKEIGVERIVPARELNLCEIKNLKEKTGLEIETFIHGALCYCYSGQCYFSSFVGGRSGNRGKCAQACRLEYRLKDRKGTYLSSKEKPYLMSLKDLNTLEILPEIIASGVTSLKIEGRMKKAEYASGVTSVYRKYLDLILSGKDYRVDPEDEEKLFTLFNREGFSEGYYKTENSAEMLALKEKEFRKEDGEWLREIREKYVNGVSRIPIGIRYSFLKDGLSKLAFERDGEVEFEYSEKLMISEAISNPTTKESVEEKLKKLGNTDFTVRDIRGHIDEKIFIPVSRLNEFRHKALENYRTYLKTATNPKKK